MNRQDAEDLEIARHFMRALKVALAERDLTAAAAEEKAGLAPGTIGWWLRGKRTPSALRFAKVAASLGIDPGELLNSGYARAVEAGLLADVETIPRDE